MIKFGGIMGVCLLINMEDKAKKTCRIDIGTHMV
jgi:hypothetical protein